MICALRPLLALSLVAAASAAIAGASSTPFGYRPDPALQTASVADLQGRVRDSCASVQARLQNASTAAMARPCGCYADRVMRTFDAVELAAYRQSGVFNDTARSKAFAALDQCKLRRPG